MSHPQWSLGAQDRTAREFVPGSPCPCQIEGCTGSKLSVKTGHVARSCVCRSCMGRRNRTKGKAANARAHRRLAPQLARTIDDDIFHAYPLEVSVEVKTGAANLPAHGVAFCRSEWARHAWRQAEKKVPEGVQAYPAIVMEVTPSESYMVVKLT